MAERIKCKPPKKAVARSEPVRTAKPQGSTDSEDSDADLDLEPAYLDRSRSRSPPRRISLEPQLVRPRRRAPLEEQPPVDLDALRDKYRPKVAEKEPAPLADDLTKADDKSNKPTGTILLEPPLEEIKVEPIQPTYVEMKKPLSK